MTLSPGLRGVRVLVVVNIDDSRDVLVVGLRYSGAVVTTAPSAREALPLSPVVDVVVMTCRCPERMARGSWLRSNRAPGLFL
jgi:CheY-like chemotaxis protein